MPAEFICIMEAAQTDAGGPEGPVVSLVLTDVGGTFTRTAFAVPDEVRHEMLAQALAAINLGSRVFAVLDDPASTSRQCHLLSVGSGF
jgi:hypothetical protein